MKEYRKVLEALATMQTIKSRYNKLATIRLNTEDEHLKERIKSFLAALAHYSSTKRGSEEVQTTTHNLKDYCKGMLQSEKPQWQILAERHGWTPPKNVTPIR